MKSDIKKVFYVLSFFSGFEKHVFLSLKTKKKMFSKTLPNIAYILHKSIPPHPDAREMVGVVQPHYLQHMLYNYHSPAQIAKAV
jgi:hypothetical protein